MIVCLGELYDPAVASQGRAVEVRTVPNLDALGQDHHLVRGLIVRYPHRIAAAELDRLPALKVIATSGSGCDNVDLIEASRRGIDVRRTLGVNATAVAEHAIALTCALAKGLVRARDDWRGPTCHALTELTLGIVGLGHVGRATATLAQALGMRVVAYDLAVNASCVAELLTLDALLKASTVISLHVPLDDSTRNMVGEAWFYRMAGCYLVNTSRGAVVDEDSLRRALCDGPLAAAALDVTSTDPSDSASPLHGLPNLLVTHHVADAIPSVRRRMSQAALSSVCAALDLPIPIWDTADV